MRAILTIGLVSSALACGGGGGGDGDGGNGKPDACVGTECNVVDCAQMNMPPTTLTGKVFAPNGTLPLAGVNVYIPRELPLPPFTEGVSCERCQVNLPGSPVVASVSGPDGSFRLENVPAGEGVSLVITTGKWRRVVPLQSVASCTETALTANDTRLPKNRGEGDIPKIAVTTGDADSMECLPRKLGIDDSEITTSAAQGRIHMYAANGVNKFKGGFAGGSGQTLTGAEPFWSSEAKLKQYDIVILSCEGAQLPPDATAKSQGALDAMKAYADVGGRVFASHWHNVWISGKFQGGVGAPTPQVWNTVSTWADDGNFDGTDSIDLVNNPKGNTFADWMQSVGGSTTRGEFAVTQGRITSDVLDKAKAEQWVTRKGGGNNAQMFQFTTPLEAPSDTRCGKVVFTDMHVSGTHEGGDYPDSCVGGANNLTLTAQEKALAFMFFDIASCVGGIL